MTRILFLIFFCCLLLKANAQQQVVSDSSSVDIRDFKEERIRAYKEDSDYHYDLVLEPPKSLWDRFWTWFWSKIDDMLSTRSGKRTFSVVIVLLAVAVVVYAVMKLTGMNRGTLFGTKNTGESLPYSTIDENIHTISFEESIDTAVAARNFRLAVRLLYLQTLKKLSDKELIHWQINKTNIAYVQELSGTAFQQPFDRLTLMFETNWYGDRHIEAEAFKQVKEEFNAFNKKLH